MLHLIAFKHSPKQWIKVQRNVIKEKKVKEWIHIFLVSSFNSQDQIHLVNFLKTQQYDPSRTHVSQSLKLDFGSYFSCFLKWVKIGLKRVLCC